MNSIRAGINKLDQRYCAAFAGTWLTGLFCHAMMLFNKFCLHDDITYTFNYGSSIASGRWALELLGKLETFIYGGNGHFSLPVVNGFFSIFFIALSACLIVFLLDIKSSAACAFVGGIMVAFPTVTATFFYMFTSHYYFLAYFLTALGTVLICRGKKAWMKAAAILMIAFSIGVYQAYIPTAVALMVLYLIRMLHKRDGLQAIIRKMADMAICTALYMIVYFAANKLFLFVTKTQLVNHKGIDTMESTSILGYLKRLPAALKYFFNPPYTGTAVVYPLHIRFLYYLVLICLIGGALLTCIRLLVENVSYGILYILLCLVFPVAVTLICIMVPDVPHQLMEYAQVLPFIALIMMVEESAAYFKGRAAKAIRYSAGVCCCLLLLLYAQFSNVSYLKAEFVQEEAKSYFTTLVTRIRSTEGYRDNMRVTFLNLKELDDSSMGNIASWFEGYPVSGDFDLQKTITGYSYRYFLARWCGFKPRWTGQKIFMEDPERAKQVEDMACYPDDGSIKIIDDKVVVNFGPMQDVAD